MGSVPTRAASAAIAASTSIMIGNSLAAPVAAAAEFDRLMTEESAAIAAASATTSTDVHAEQKNMASRGHEAAVQISIERAQPVDAAASTDVRLVQVVEYDPSATAVYAAAEKAVACDLGSRYGPPAVCLSDDWVIDMYVAANKAMANN